MNYNPDGMYIYILQGTKGLYICVTEDLQRRYKEHLRGVKYNGAVSHSKRVAGGDLQIEHWWNVDTRYEAEKVESYLQAAHKQFGDSWIWRFVNDCPVNISLLLKEALAVPDSRRDLYVKSKTYKFVT